MKKGLTLIINLCFFISLSNSQITTWQRITNNYAKTLTVDSVGNFYLSKQIGVDKSTDQGTTWSTTSYAAPSRDGHNTHYGSAAWNNMLFVASLDYGLWISSDEGATWQNTFSTGYGTGANRLISNNNAIVMNYGGSLRGIYKFNTSNSTWTQKITSSVDFWDFAVDKDGYFYATLSAGGDWQGGIYKSTDDGETWSKIYATSNEDNPISIAYLNDTLICISFNEKVMRSTDFGTSWTQIATFPGVDASELQYFGNNYLFASSSSGIYYSTDNGINWTPHNSGIPSSATVFRLTEYKNKLYVASDSGLFKLETYVNLSGLVAYYPFNGNANDESGNGNNGTVYGSTLTTDRFGYSNKAYYFNPGTYISVSHNSIFNVSSDMTISTWYKLKPNGSQGTMHIIGKRDDEFGIPTSFWSIWAQVPTRKMVYSLFNNFSSQDYHYSEKSIDTSAWQHVVAVVKNDTSYIYLDGVLDSSSPITIERPTNTKPILIGWDRDTYTIESFVGSIDDIHIYNRALSEIEIDSLYHEDGWDGSSTISVTVGNIDVTVNDTVEIPVSVKFPLGKSYSSMELSFVGFQNPGVTFLNIDTTDCLIGEKGWQLLSNNTDSVLVIASAGSQDISDSLLLFKLKFLVSGNPCSSVPIEIKDAVFNTGLDSVIKINGGININPIVEYGDVDGNGRVQAFDASLILKHLVGLDTLNCQSMWNAMVHCDPQLTAFDATLILQRVTSLIDTLPYCLQQQATGVITMSSGSRRIGDIIEIPLNLSNANNIYSYEGTITYDPLKLEYDGIIADGVFSNDSFMSACKNGFVRFAGARNAPNDPTNIFATIKFRVKNDGLSTVTLTELRWNTEPTQKNVASTTIVTDVSDSKEEIPQYFSLYQNQPNPFNPTTTFKYDLSTESQVKLSIYNVLGQIEEIIVDDVQSAGHRSIEWNAKGMVSGVYFYQLEATSLSDPSKSFKQVKKMLLVK